MTATQPDILRRFENVQPEKPGQWNCRCPAHEDNRNSLAVSIKSDGTVLISCLANCETSDVLAAVGLELKDLFPKTAARGGNRVEAYYDYRDETKLLLYQALRYEGKKFLQRSPKPGGGWEWKLNGARRVLYRLPELLAADKSATVFVPEGEKDVDNLRALGFVATTNVAGAGKWKDEYSPALAGRNVVILEDNDDAGRKHVQQVANSLRGFAASIKIVTFRDLPAHGDVSDWLAAGGTKAELLKLVAVAPEWEGAVPQKVPKGADDWRSESVLRGGDEICNAVVTKSEGERFVDPLPMVEIVRRIRKRTDEWPRRIGSALFIHETDGNIQWLETCPALFGWLGTKCPPAAKFTPGVGCHSREEVFHELRRTSIGYQTVELLPHEPRFPDHFYACEMPEAGDGATLEKFLDRFSPATPVDRDLFLAMFATMFWGGAAGSRPAFLLTSDDGRGAGKSKSAAMAAYLGLGMMDLSANEPIDEIKKRLLSPEGITKRVALLDNVKTLRFSWAELESIVTNPVISGKRMYVGEGQRPNTLLWIITLNGASLSTDMAQRCVIIKVKRPIYCGSWEDETRAFIDEHRTAIIADLIGFLRRPACQPRKYTRWGTWERDVLARLPDPTEAQSVITERQGEADVEQEEAEVLAEFIRAQLAALRYDVERDRVFLPSATVCRWMGEATNDKFSVTAASRILSQKIDEGKMPQIKRSAGRAYGRGFEWIGDKWNCSDEIKTDIEYRGVMNQTGDA